MTVLDYGAAPAEVAEADDPDGATQDLLDAWAELEAARPGYEQAYAYACGHVDEVFSSTGTIAEKLSKASRSYSMPLIATAIWARVDRMKITTVKIAETEEPDPWITEVWNANDLDVWYPELFWLTCVFGDAYVQVHPIEEEIDRDVEMIADGAPADTELVTAGVEFTVHDPRHVRMLYEAQHTRRKRLLISRWPVSAQIPGSDEKVWRVDLWYADRVEHWISLPAGDLSQPSAWHRYAEDGPDADTVMDTVEEGFGEIPFFHHRTSMPYGVPVHEAGYGAQNAITKMLATQVDTADEQGWPSRYRLLDPEAELDTNSDTPEFLNDDDSEIFTGVDGMAAHGGVSTAVRSGPGSMTTYPGTKEVGQLDAADPELFLGPAKVYLNILATLTRTPHSLFYPEETNIGAAPSGAALAKAEAPLNSSVQRLQTLQRGAIREEWTFAGGLLDNPVKPGQLDVQWEPVDRATSLEDWQVVQLKQQTGVPVDRTLEEAGYTPEDAAQWQADQEAKQEEANQAMLDAISSGAVKGKDPRAPGSQGGPR